MSTRKPAYQLIKAEILANIHNGVWQVGSAIPTEIALSEQFSVSRMTVNRALKELAEEKVLERRQGSGTFVAQKHFNHTFVEVRNIAHDIQEDHHGYHAEVLVQKELDFAEIPQDIQVQFLKSKKNSKSKKSIKSVALVSIVHFADDLPLQFEERWVNLDLVADFLEQDFTQANSSDFLMSRVPLESGEYTISAQQVTTEIAQALAIPMTEPVLLLNRVTVSQGQVVTVVNMWHAGSRYQFSGKLG
ncbi:MULTISPECIES: UTRA domain-containing protein [unclassified Acinetobacter]|uniref:UTRA domain-containing protein n=1 Tax=unclassified Acinetobacter TaxID=196816 RepID=UPI0035B8F1FF